MVRVFQHESKHDTDKQYIQDYKNKREGKENKNIDNHKNVDPQDKKVYDEYKESNEKK